MYINGTIDEITDLLDSLSNIIGKDALKIAIEQYDNLAEPEGEGEMEPKRIKIEPPASEGMEISIPDRAFIETFSNAKWFKVAEEIFVRGCIDFDNHNHNR